METVRLRGFGDLDKVHERLVACVAVGPISVGDTKVHISDVFIPGARVIPMPTNFESITKHVRKSRAVRWEDDPTQLLDEGTVTPELVRASRESRRTKAVDAVLAKWSKRRRTTA